MPKKVYKPPATRLPESGFIRVGQLVPHIIPIGRTTLWSKIKSGEFPKPVNLGLRSVAFRVEDVRAWMEARA